MVVSGDRSARTVAFDSQVVLDERIGLESTCENLNEEDTNSNMLGGRKTAGRKKHTLNSEARHRIAEA
jgi:hypothetical protein